MFIIDASTLKQFVDQIQTRSRDWLASGVKLDLHPRQIVRKWSLMLRFKAYHGGISAPAVLVKITRHQSGTIEDAIADKSLVFRTRREFEMLRSVEEIFSNDKRGPWFCCIHPLAVMDDWNALITEELECKPLKKYLLTLPMLLGLPSHWNRFELLLGRSARWLHFYHQHMGNQEQVSLEQIGAMDLANQYLNGINRAVERSEMSSIHETLDAIWLRCRTLPVPTAVLHGDFHCSNLLVTRDMRVGSLDAECVRGSIYEDIAKLLADLETRSLQVYTLGALIPAVRMRQLRESVLQGYFVSSTADIFLLELFLMLALLQKWKIDEDLLIHSSGMGQMLRKIFSPLRRHYMIRILKQHLAALTRQPVLSIPTEGLALT